jgi:hypothetical protein
MNNISKFIKDALEYYDNSNDCNMSYINKIKHIQFINKDTDIESDTINFYNSDNEIVLTTKYEILGIYYSKNKTWTWGWALPWIYKNKTNTVKKLLDYGYNITGKSDIDLFIKSLIVSSTYKLNNIQQLDIIRAITIYLTKSGELYSKKEYVDSDKKDYIDYSYIINK